jgi:hypothetical protein
VTYNLGMYYSWMRRILALLLLPATGFALDGFNAGNVSDLSAANVESMIELVAIGGNHRAFQPATPLGNALGLDISLDVAAISVPEDFKTALALASDTSTDQVPGLLPLPKLNIHKGLPGGINLGFSYVSYQDQFRIYGFDAQWAFLRKPVTPNVALRFSAAYTKLYYIQTRNFGLDVVVSKRLAVIDPYLGLGIQYWNGTLALPFPAGTPTGLTEGVPDHASSADPHIFVGLPIKLIFLKITGEIDYSFAGITTYGGKIGLSF